MLALVLSPTNNLELKEHPTPVCGQEDIIVEVKAIGINPVDLKQKRAGTQRRSTSIIGWDASGVVQTVGSKVSHFKAGDHVFYAGALQRDGCYAQLQAVDQALVALKPHNLSFAEAAALPLTSLTAWEALFEKLHLKAGQTLLIINGAGGVGSMAIQLAHHHGATVVATASRLETQNWARLMGAEQVIDHSQPLLEAFQSSGIQQVDCILNTHDTNGYFGACCDILGPDGKLCCIVSPNSPLDISPLFAKRIELSFEFMFSKALYKHRVEKPQSEILAEIASLVEAGQLRTTATTKLRGLSVETFEQAHEIIGSGRSIGKLVVEL